MTNKELFQRLFAIIKPYNKLLTIAVVTMILYSGFQTVQAWLLKPVIDELFIKKDIDMLLLLPIVIIVIFFLKGCCYYTYTFLLEKAGQSIVQQLRIDIFSHIHKQPLSFFHKYPTGTLISRVISDVTLMQQAVSNALVGVARDFLQIIFLLGLVFYLNWKLAMVTFIILPIATIPIVKFGKLFRKLSVKTQEETAKVSDRLYETITGNRIVKAFCRENYEIIRFQKQISTLFTVIIKVAKYKSMQHPLMEFIGGIAVSFIVWFGGKEVIEGVTTPGEFFSFLVALVAAYDPMKGVSKVNPAIQQGLAAATRIFTLLDEQPAITDKKDAEELPPFSDRIDIRKISFSYEPGIPIMRDISLSVPIGQALAIVGPSGGGKTTLTNLLPRFLDIQEGSITIDGKDIRDVTLTSLRNQIAMVTQQTILFNDSIRNNIRYGAPEASDHDVEKAAEAAYATGFIENCPQGFDTIIGEGGTRLSGGERQRISIARAILKNAPILILDEATSALDTESEREVQQALENLMRNKTTLVIAHRLSTIKNCDKIIVIKEGKIVEQGTHEELLELHGTYEILYRMQYK